MSRARYLELAERVEAALNRADSGRALTDRLDRFTRLRLDDLDAARAHLTILLDALRAPEPAPLDALYEGPL